MARNTAEAAMRLRALVLLAAVLAAALADNSTATPGGLEEGEESPAAAASNATAAASNATAEQSGAAAAAPAPADATAAPPAPAPAPAAVNVTDAPAPAPAPAPAAVDSVDGEPAAPPVSAASKRISLAMLAARPKNATKGANSSVVPDPTADQDDLPEKEPEPEAPKGPGDVTIGWAAQQKQFPANAVPPPVPPPPVPVVPPVDFSHEECGVCVNKILTDCIGSVFPCEPKTSELNEMCMSVCIQYDHYRNSGPLAKPYRNFQKLRYDPEGQRKLCYLIVHPQAAGQEDEIAVPPTSLAAKRAAQVKADAPRKAVSAPKPAAKSVAMPPTKSKAPAPAPAPVVIKDEDTAASMEEKPSAKKAPVAADDEAAFAEVESKSARVNSIISRLIVLKSAMQQ